jgi:hypothetical protein
MPLVVQRHAPIEFEGLGRTAGAGKIAQPGDVVLAVTGRADPLEVRQQDSRQRIVGEIAACSATPATKR